MPVQKRYRRKRGYNRRPARKARSGRRRYGNLTRTVVPDYKVVKLRYTDQVSLNPSAAGATNHIFAANGMYDPNITGVGHQPMGYDQWQTFYNHYTVLGAKITAIFSSPSTVAAVGNGVVGILLKDNNTGIGATTEIIEQARAHWRVMSTKDGSRSVVTVTHSFSSKKFFGLKDVKDNRDEVGALFTSNPAELAYFHVFVGCLGAADDVGTTDVLVTIEYIAQLTERKALAAS